MTKTDWISGDRRTDTFVILLVLAPILTFLISDVWRWVESGAPNFSNLKPLGADEWPGVARALAQLWIWARTAVLYYGVPLPFVVGACALVRLLSVRTAVIVVALIMAFAAVICGSCRSYELIYRHYHGSSFNGYLWLSAVTWPLSEWVRFCALPVAVTTFLRSSDPRTEFGNSRSLAAELTRIWMFATAIIWLSSGGLDVLGSLVLSGLGVQPGVPVPGTTPAPILNQWRVCSLTAAFLLTVLGTRSIRRGRIVRWVIIAAVVTGLCSVACMEWLTFQYYSASRSLSAIAYVRGFLSTTANTLPADVLILWYWWPLLRRRIDPTLLDEPHCADCGYCLTGNVTGRCPECGAPCDQPGVATRSALAPPPTEPTNETFE